MNKKIFWTFFVIFIILGIIFVFNMAVKFDAGEVILPEQPDSLRETAPSKDRVMEEAIEPEDEIAAEKRQIDEPLLN